MKATTRSEGRPSKCFLAGPLGGRGIRIHEAGPDGRTLCGIHPSRNWRMVIGPSNCELCSLAAKRRIALIPLQIRFPAIQNAVAREFRVRPEGLHHRTHCWTLSLPRAAAVFLMRQLTSGTWLQIAEFFDSFASPQSARAAYGLATAECETNPRFCAALGRVQARLGRRTPRNSICSPSRSTQQPCRKDDYAP
jgi:hypothetical protein